MRGNMGDIAAAGGGGDNSNCGDTVAAGGGAAGAIDTIGTSSRCWYDSYMPRSPSCTSITGCVEIPSVYMTWGAAIIRTGIS